MVGSSAVSAASGVVSSMRPHEYKKAIVAVFTQHACGGMTSKATGTGAGCVDQGWRKEHGKRIGRMVHHTS
eukprot:6522709-Lingulodinium_polyedra.AAC.1